MATQYSSSEAPYAVITHDPNIVPKYITAACFDGGGVRAISAAIVLKSIMDRLEEETFVPQADKLHEHFDMLAGTGTGGLLALLLGRLRVPLQVERIIEIYKNIFRGGSESLSEENLRNVVREYESDNYADAQLLDEREDAIFVHVLASQTNNAAGTPKVKRSLNTDDPGTTVGRALAICATSTNFGDVERSKNYSSGKERLNNLSGDSRMGHSNPTVLSIREARNVHGPGVRFALLLNVGSGAEKGEKKPPQERVTDDSNDIHDLVLEMFASTALGVYVRINVPGLEDIAPDEHSAIQTIAERTERYLKTDEAANAVEHVVKTLRNHVRAIARNHESSTFKTNLQTHDDGDVNRYFVIKKFVVTVDLTEAMLKSGGKSLQVICKDYSNEPFPFVLDDHDGQIRDVNRRRWTFDQTILMFPEESCDIQFAPDKKKHAKVTISYEDIAGLYADCGEMRVDHSSVEKFDIVTSRSSPPQNWTVTLNVLMGDIDNLAAPGSSKDLDYLLDAGDILTAQPNETVLVSMKKVQDFLESNLLINGGWRAFEGVVNIVKAAHPLVNAVISALKVPYYLLRNAAKFVQEVQNLANAMRFACRCLVTARYHTTSKLAKTLFVNVMRLVRNAAVFINVYCKKGQIRQVIETQFPRKLDMFSKDLEEASHKFEIAMLLQIACEVDKMAYESSDSFLRKRLKPIEQHALSESCLPGTRVNILNDVRTWLKDHESRDILWILGAPGAGKSTIATTIAHELRRDGHPCAKFFAKRDIPDLRDPRRIWPSIAYSLAERHDGLKMSLVDVLGQKPNIDIQDDTVFDQFQKLVKWPLEMDLKRTRGKGYPVIIIDALDECKSGRDWISLLNVFAEWPVQFKLIITSRDYDVLHEKLDDVSHRINLSVGPGVSMDSKGDIKVFFTTKFIEMKLRNDFKSFILPHDWPGGKAIQEMTDFAAGLFIWADMAVSYVAPMENDNAGYDPVERLQRVLSDIQAEGRRSWIVGADRVDNLYGRIIFEAFPRLEDSQRQRAKRILATILLAKVPLSRTVLVELMSSNEWNSHNAVASTLIKLRPIIPASNDKLRVVHKSVSDFTLSCERSLAALSRFEPDLSTCISYMIYAEEENKQLALACLSLMHRKLSCLDICDIPRLLDPNWEAAHGFSYARQYSLEHFEDHQQKGSENATSRR